mmetsp:Transcript_31454/g.73223  ORF Transcript_31454/g.73223 Transcript_31454/m.73223 type:complete len:315 (-) Transcript_31454:791-1735(-)
MMSSIELEEVTDLRHGRLGAIGVLGAQVAHRPVQQLVDDTFRHHLHSLLLLVREALELLHRLGELSGAHLLELALQVANRRHILQRLLPRCELGLFDTQQRLRLEYLLSPLGLVARHHLLEVIDVVGGHLADLVALRLDVPWHRDINKNEILAALAPDALLEQRLCHNAPRRRCGSECEVRRLHRRPQLVHQTDMHVELGVLFRERVRTLGAAVQQRELCYSMRCEVRHKELRHLAGADDQHTRLVQRLAKVRRALKDGELDCRRRYGHGALRDLRLGSHILAAHHSKVEQSPQNLTSAARGLVACVVASENGM